MKREERDKKKEVEKEAMKKQLEEEIRRKMIDHEKQRQEMIEKWKSDEKELAKKKYTHVEMEERYNKKVIMPSLERKKEELRKKREYFQPIRRKDLLEHERIYEQRLQMKLREKREKREKWYKDIGYGDYDPTKYHSKYLSSAEQEEKVYTPDPMIGVIEQLDKQKNYAKFVKEMHKPKISVRK